MERPIFNSRELPRFVRSLPVWVTRIIFLLVLIVSPLGWPVLFLIDEFKYIWGDYKQEMGVIWRGVIGRWV